MRKTPKKRSLDVFSLSFLDCICCAFGAVILLFVLSKFGPPLKSSTSEQRLDDRAIEQAETSSYLKEQISLWDRKVHQATIELDEVRKRLARLQGDLAKVEGQFAATSGDAQVQNRIEGQLARARQELTAEMRRLLAYQPPPPPSRSIGGIPVDSEYIIFIIDTSGSMQRYTWSLVRKKIKETLQIYPQVKGIQVLNDMGNYMFPQYRGQWIPDTPARRKAIVNTLRTWRSFSNSSPVEGIQAAIRTFYARDKKISLYVFGDEFSGPDIQAVVSAVDRINRTGPGGSRRVRIHAVGFPVVLQETRQQGSTGERFATLMRALCQRNGGTFVGLNQTRP
jgi:hypothetical protein